MRFRFIVVASLVAVASCKKSDEAALRAIEDGDDSGGEIVVDREYGPGSARSNVTVNGVRGGRVVRTYNKITSPTTMQHIFSKNPSDVSRFANDVYFPSRREVWMIPTSETEDPKGSGRETMSVDQYREKMREVVRLAIEDTDALDAEQRRLFAASSRVGERLSAFSKKVDDNQATFRDPVAISKLLAHGVVDKGFDKLKIPELKNGGALQDQLLQDALKNGLKTAIDQIPDGKPADPNEEGVLYNFVVTNEAGDVVKTVYKYCKDKAPACIKLDALGKKAANFAASKQGIATIVVVGAAGVGGLIATDNVDALVDLAEKGAGLIVDKIPIVNWFAPIVQKGVVENVGLLVKGVNIISDNVKIAEQRNALFAKRVDFRTAKRVLELIDILENADATPQPNAPTYAAADGAPATPPQIEDLEIAMPLGSKITWDQDEAAHLECNDLGEVYTWLGRRFLKPELAEAFVVEEKGWRFPTEGEVKGLLEKKFESTSYVPKALTDIPLENFKFENGKDGLRFTLEVSLRSAVGTAVSGSIGAAGVIYQHTGGLFKCRSYYDSRNYTGDRAGMACAFACVRDLRQQQALDQEKEKQKAEQQAKDKEQPAKEAEPPQQQQEPPQQQQND